MPYGYNSPLYSELPTGPTDATTVAVPAFISLESLTHLKEVVLFLIIKWCCFQLLKIKLYQPSGAIFVYKVVLFSFDKNKNFPIEAGNSSRSKGC